MRQPFTLVTVEDLYRQYRDRLVAFAIVRGARVDEAEDFVHDAFEWALQNYDPLRTGSPLAMLRRVTELRMLQRFQVARRQAIPAGDLAASDWISEMAEPVADEPTNDGFCMGDPDTVLYVMAALEELTPRQREAMTLWAVDRLGYAEIADRMGITYEGVRVHIKVGLRSLRAS